MAKSSTLLAITNSGPDTRIGILRSVAPVAQLDRASGYEPEGRVFESLRAHHFEYVIDAETRRCRDVGHHTTDRASHNLYE